MRIWRLRGTAFDAETLVACGSADGRKSVSSLVGVRSVMAAKWQRSVKIQLVVRAGSEGER